MLMLLSTLALALAEKKDDNGEDSEESTPTIAEEVEDWTHYAGLFDLYLDPETGELRMVIDADDLGKEYIHFAQTRDGVLESGHFRGSYRGEMVFRIEKSYDKIEFIQENTSFYFDPESPIAKADMANISPSVLAALDIEVTDEDDDGNPTRYLIDAGELFLNEVFAQIKPSSRGGGGDRFSLGSLSGGKTKFVNVHNYQGNSDFVVDYVYENDRPTNYGSEAVTNARNVTVQMHHSIIAMPKNEYEPRIDDFRVGYFHNRVTDQTSSEPAPYRDLINRWNLVKKDPEAAVSDPIEPIVWWMENTTPVQFRDAIKEGVEAWNVAFEAAGFSNAVVVKMQPEDADWDAGDINHNVLRWTASPIPPFGGYGPSFPNPRTGQLLGADIMLEWIYVNNRYKYQDLYLPEKSNSQGVHMHNDNDGHVCDFPVFLADNLQMGLSTLEARGVANAEVNELIKQSIKHLVLHEVGHTLGLNHNMKASQTVSLENLHNTDWTDKHGLVGSVMDYTPINLAPEGVTQGKYFADAPGTYDIWAIQFGYDPDMNGDKRDAHLKRSMEPLLTFGNDADDMRSAGKAIDPRVNIGDLSGDTLAWSEQRLNLIDETLASLTEVSLKDGESFQLLVNNFSTLMRQKSSVGGIVSRYVGGVYVERGTTEQFADVQPYTPASLATQKEAMTLLGTHFFAPESFDVAMKLLPYLQPERRGYDFFSSTEDPKILESIERIQANILRHVLHPTVLRRMENSALYGNEYSIDDAIGDLSKQIFFGDLRGTVNAHRQRLQTMYVEELLYILDNEEYLYSSTAQAVAHQNLRDIQGWLALSGGGDIASKRHRQYIRQVLTTNLDD